MHIKRSLIIGLLLLPLRAGAQDPPTDPATEPAPAPAETIADVQARLLSQIKQHMQRLRKAGSDAEREQVIMALAATVSAGDKAGIDAGALAVLHNLYGFALGRVDKGEAGLRELRRAVELDPADAEFRSDLADALLDEEEYDAAIAAAAQGLTLSPSAKVRDALVTTLAKARRERLKERLSVSASVEIGYDSNIQQGTSVGDTEVQTIAGRSTGSAARTVAASRPRPRQISASSFGSGFASAITGIYTTPTPMTSQDGVPISLDLSVEGRLAAGKRVGLWLGYSFTQLFQTLPDQDAYDFQQHDVTLRLDAKPWERLSLELGATGFASFSGLQAFAPFQGGIAGKLKLTIKESKRFRTFIRYTHRYAASFAAEDAALNSDSDELQLIQELRTKPIRLQLSYTLRDSRSGVLETPVDYEATFTSPRTGQAMTVAVGQYLYTTPLGYLGNKVGTKLHVDLPAQLQLDFNAGYEYRLYDGLTAATFTPAAPQLTLPQGTIVTSPVTLPAVQRADHVVSLSLAIERSLPHGFSLALAYAFLDNLSSVANSLDNRSYIKHTVSLTAGYEF